MKKPPNYLNAEYQIFNRSTTTYIAEINAPWGAIIRFVTTSRENENMK